MASDANPAEDQCARVRAWTHAVLRHSLVTENGGSVPPKKEEAAFSNGLGHCAN